LQLNRLTARIGALFFVLAAAGRAAAQPIDIPLPALELGVRAAEGPADVALTLQIVALLTVLSLAPAIVVMLTSFTRIIVVLSFVRSALSLQQLPPNQVLIGLALFLTFFTMAPTWQAAYEAGLAPYLAGELSELEALERASQPLREFMFRHVNEQDLALFIELQGAERPATRDDVSMTALIPAFIISELRTAFQLGFILFIPFLVIDMIVASVLMSMGMLMLPPVMISLPFKVLLFVLVDGWHLITRSLVLSFQ